MKKTIIILAAALVLLLCVWLLYNSRDHANPPMEESVITEWVDMGLPSGLLWASYNVGATSPEDYGNHYAWGDTTAKDIFNVSTYPYAKGSYDQLTKYCDDARWGYHAFSDDITTLLPDDDVASHMGEGARTPSKKEWEELMQNTTSVWTTQNGVCGRRFTSANGNSIFLPAAGQRWDGEHSYVNEDGYYWSSSLVQDSPNGAWYFFFNADKQSIYSSGGRGNGFTVRAVRPVQD